MSPTICHHSEGYRCRHCMKNRICRISDKMLPKSAESLRCIKFEPIEILPDHRTCPLDNVMCNVTDLDRCINCAYEKGREF